MMKNPQCTHDEEWSTGWKSHPKAFATESRFQLVSELAATLAPISVFDLGCGNGIQGQSIKKSIPGVSVKGCDISTTAVNKALGHLDEAYILDIDKSELPEESDSYDLVLCIAVLEHLYDVSHALTEMHRILKKRKHIIIQVPNLSFWRFRWEILRGRVPSVLLDPRHLQTFNRNTLVELLQDAGFTNCRVFGQRQRIKLLAKIRPSIFSENLFVLAEKQP